MNFYLEDQARFLYKLADNVFKLKSKLLCSICLDVYETPTGVKCCDHIFCEKCITCYLKQTTDFQVPCPICQKLVDGSFILTYHSLNKAINFVTLGEQELKKLDIDVSVEQSYSKIYNALQRTKSTSLPDQINSTESDNSNLIRLFKVLVTTNDEVLAFDDNMVLEYCSQAVNSSTKKRRNAKRRLPMPCTSIKGRNTTKNDSFDILKQSATINPLYQSTRTYKRVQNPRNEKNG